MDCTLLPAPASIQRNHDTQPWNEWTEEELHTHAMVSWIHGYMNWQFSVLCVNIEQLFAHLRSSLLNSVVFTAPSSQLDGWHDTLRRQLAWKPKRETARMHQLLAVPETFSPSSGGTSTLPLRLPVHGYSRQSYQFDSKENALIHKLVCCVLMEHHRF